MSDEETTDFIQELFGKALSYDHVFTEILAKRNENRNGNVDEIQDMIPGLIFNTEPRVPRKVPIVVVKLPTTQKEMPAIDLIPRYIKIEWEVLPTKDKDDICIPDLDIINSEEDKLAKKLKSYCDTFGKEANQKLFESAKIMIVMGKLYLDRAVCCSALVDILTYVKDSGNFEIIASRYERASNAEYNPEPYIYDVSKELVKEASARLPEDDVNIISSTLRKIADDCLRATHKGASDNPDALISPNDYLAQVAAHFKTEQKLSLIKAAGLVIAGKVRLEKIKDEIRQNIAGDLFTSILREILISAGSKVSAECITSDFLSRMDLVLFAKRTARGEDLENVASVGNNDSEVVRHEKESKKISQIRKLCASNAQTFITFMRDISEKCQQMLGKSPCKFAIVGLGSLARNEVTLYSDFEHAIVLQNDAEGRENWPATQEYFRWFTVLFHAIVIGLGETVLPGLDIRGLCEKDSRKCWFYDAYTPNGISFDGMMPHACKIPLGRPRKTRFKEHTVELIQTAKRMAQYLTREEDIKNGYFLKEVLSTTCFVDGDLEVYESFLKECRAVISREKQENLATRVAKYILLNPLATVNGSYRPFHAKEESNKNLTYRPLTTHIGHFAQICGIECKDSFGILDEMKSKKVVDEETYHTLASAMAVAIEVNLKVYQKSGSQRITALPCELAGLVGERSWIDCQVVLEVVGDCIKYFPIVCCTKFGLPPRDSTFWKILSCLYLPILNLFQSAAKGAFNCLIFTLEQYTNGNIHARHAENVLGDLLGCLRHSFLRVYLERFANTAGSEVLVFRRTLPEDGSYELSACEWACHKILQLGGSDLPSLELQSSACQSLCVIRFNQKKYEEGLEYFKRWEAMTHGRKSDQVDMWMYEMLMRMEVMGNENVVTYIKRKVLENIPTERKLVLDIIRCQVWINVGYLEKAKRELLRLSFAVKSYSRKMTEYSTEYLLRIIREMQMNNKFQNHVATSNILLKSIMSKNEMKLTSDYSRRKEKIVMEDDVRARVKESRQKRSHSYVSPVGTRDVLLMNNLSNMLPVCFTHDELLGMANVIFTRSKVASDVPMRIAPHAFALMALFESANDQDAQTAVQAFREAPHAVKAYRPMQPFIYGFMKSLLNERQLSTMHRHDNVLRAIFGHQSEHKLFDSALSEFINLRFGESLQLLWKICHQPGIAKTVEKQALELFITVVIAVLLDRKRQNPYSYFTKTRELSTKQLQWVRAVHMKKNKEFSKRNIERANLHIFRDLPLARVYNFAMNGNDQHPGRMCFFYWRILHYPKESKVVKKAALLALCDAVVKADVVSNNPVRSWP